MGLRDRLRTLARRAEGPMVEIEQPDGTYARFPQSELEGVMNSLTWTR
jgi:hypothetical protein